MCSLYYYDSYYYYNPKPYTLNPLQNRLRMPTPSRAPPKSLSEDSTRLQPQPMHLTVKLLFFYYSCRYYPWYDWVLTNPQDSNTPDFNTPSSGAGSSAPGTAPSITGTATARPECADKGGLVVNGVEGLAFRVWLKLKRLWQCIQQTMHSTRSAAYTILAASLFLNPKPERERGESNRNTKARQALSQKTPKSEARLWDVGKACSNAPNTEVD